jgi:hypothetical protein
LTGFDNEMNDILSRKTYRYLFGPLVSDASEQWLTECSMVRQRCRPRSDRRSNAELDGKAANEAVTVGRQRMEVDDGSSVKIEV